MVLHIIMATPLLNVSEFLELITKLLSPIRKYPLSLQCVSARPTMAMFSTMDNVPFAIAVTKKFVKKKYMEREKKQLRIFLCKPKACRYVLIELTSVLFPKFILRRYGY